MDQTKLATIIVPIYNVEAYLAECIESLLVQTYRNLQIILVDDGSPDGCGAICDEYAARDSRIEVVHKPNGGLGSARNAGMDIARGEYIYFVDSDDSTQPELVRTTLEEMEAQHWDMCSFGSMAFEDSDPSKVSPLNRPDRKEFHYETESERSRFLCRYFLRARIRWEAWSRVFRRDIIEQHHIRFGNERKIFAEDLDFSFRYLQHCSSVVCLPVCLHNYRLRGGSIMHTKKWISQCQQLGAMLVWQQEQVGGVIPFGKGYLNEAVIIATFLGTFGKDNDPIQKAGQLRQVLRESENWGYIEQEMKLASADAAAFRSSSGILYGTFLHALCAYLADDNFARYTRKAKLYYGYVRLYEQLREVKRILLQLRGRK